MGLLNEANKALGVKETTTQPKKSKGLLQDANKAIAVEKANPQPAQQTQPNIFQKAKQAVSDLWSQTQEFNKQAMEAYYQKVPQARPVAPIEQPFDLSKGVIAQPSGLQAQLETPVSGESAKISPTFDAKATFENNLKEVAKRTSGTGIVATLKSASPDVTFQEAYDTMKKSQAENDDTLLEKFRTGLVDSAPQTAIGVLLGFIPYAGIPLSMAYWSSISAGSELQEKGKITPSNVAIDVLGDMVLGGTLESLFKQPAKTLLATLKKTFTVEGGTEVAQDLLKFANDYRLAKTDQERQLILQQAKNYITSGDILVTAGVGGVSGAGIGTATYAGQQILSPQIPQPAPVQQPVPVQEQQPVQQPAQKIGQPTGQQQAVTEQPAPAKVEPPQVQLENEIYNQLKNGNEQFVSRLRESVAEKKALQKSLETVIEKARARLERDTKIDTSIKLKSAIDQYQSDQGVTKMPNGEFKITASLRDLTKLASNPEVVRITQDRVSDLKTNKDGTITLYRVGTLRGDKRLVSASYSLKASQDFQVLHEKAFGKRKLTTFKVKPEDVKIFIGGTEAEVLVDAEKAVPVEKKVIKKKTTVVKKGGKIIKKTVTTIKKAPKKKVVSERQRIEKYIKSKETKFREADDKTMVANKLHAIGSNRTLTTKFLEHPEIKGKKFASWQYLSEMTNAGSLALKLKEKEVILDALSTDFAENRTNGEKIDMSKFRDAVVDRLMPLNVIESQGYASYGSDGVNLGNADTKTYILNSPFVHDRTGHFGSDFNPEIVGEVEIKKIPAQDGNPTDKYAVVKKGVTLTQDNVEENVFTVATTEAGAQKWIDDNMAKVGDGNDKTLKRQRGLFSHFRTFDIDITDNDGTRQTSHVAEIQSDVFQDGRADSLDEHKNSIRRIGERLSSDRTTIYYANKKISEKTRALESLSGEYDTPEMRQRIDNQIYDANQEIVRANESIEYELKNLEKEGLTREEKLDWSKQVSEQIAKVEDNIKNTLESNKNVTTQSILDDAEDYIKASEASIEELKRQRVFIENLPQKEISVPKEQSQFLSYKNTWAERTIREAINIKAGEGKDAIRFPTPRTVAFVEGYVSEDGDTLPYEVTSGDAEGELTYGDTIDYGGEEMTVVNVDGTEITVAPSTAVRHFDHDDAVREDIENRWSDTKYSFSELEKKFGEIKTEEDAQRVTEQSSTLQELAYFYSKEKDIEDEKIRFEESTTHADLKRKVAKSGDRIETYKQFISLLEDDIITKENLTKENLDNLNFKDNLEAKYGIDHGYWNYILDTYATYERSLYPEDVTNEERAKTLIEKKLNPILEKEIEENRDARSSLTRLVEEEKQRLDGIKDRKKPEQSKLKDIPKELIEQAKTSKYGFGLDYEVEWLLERMADRGYGEFSVDDFEDDFVSYQSDGYDPDYEGIYGKDHVFFEDKGYGNTEVWTIDEGAHTETFLQPNEYDPPERTSIEDFDINSFDGSQQTVLKFYDQQVIPYVKKLRKDNIELIEDDNGYQWWETKVTPEDAKGVMAFRIKDDLKKVGLTITDAQEKEIKALNKKFFGDTSIKITDQILANTRALGAYKDSVIQIINKQADPKDTFYHEAVHKYLDVFLDSGEHIKLLETAQKIYGIKDLKQVEEKLAEDFIRYAKKREGVTGAIRRFFDSLMRRIKMYLKASGQIETLYDDILAGQGAKQMSAYEKLLQSAEEIAGLKPTKIKESRLGLGVEEKAVENRLLKSISGLPEFETVNMDEQALRATRLIRRDKEFARRVAFGLEKAPDGVLPEAVFIALENKATEEGDVATIRKLARSKLVSEATVMGQRIRTLGERDPYAPTAVLQEVADARKQEVEKRYNKKVSQVISEESAKLDEEIKKAEPKVKEWATFIETIKCK